jgi:hypothetical protein
MNVHEQDTNCQFAEQPEPRRGATVLPAWGVVGEAAACRCERCSGLLYWTELREWDGSRGQDSHGALQCILCGNIIDPVIVKNRQRVAFVQEPVRPSGRRWRRTVSAAAVLNGGEPMGRER